MCFVCKGRSRYSRNRNESCRPDHLGKDRCSHCRCFRVSHVCPDINNAWERMLKQKVGWPHGRAPDLPTFAIVSIQMAAWNAGLPVEECAALTEYRPQDSNGPHCRKSLTTVWSISGKGYLWRKHDWEEKGKQESTRWEGHRHDTSGDKVPSPAHLRWDKALGRMTWNDVSHCSTWGPAELQMTFKDDSYLHLPQEWM